MFSTLMLVRHATVSDGLVNILGGGMGRLEKPAFPARLDVVLVAAYNPTDAEPADLKFRITPIDDPHNVVAEIGADKIGLPIPDGVYPSTIAGHMLVDLQELVIQNPGTYRLQSSVNEVDSIAIYFEVVAPTLATAPN